MNLETAMIERLKARLPSGVHVFSAADLADVAEGSQPTPAVHVVYHGDRPLEVNSSGRTARVEQTWLVVAAVRNVRDARVGSGARQDGMALLDQVRRALMGFQPEGASTPLKLAAAPRPGFRAGFQYLPTAFTVEIILHGDAA
ncbi:MAG: Gp37 family protein [Pseudomonadota bacterium]